MDEKSHMLDAMGQRQEAEQMKVIAEKTFAENAKHLEELEAKAARVDDLENKLALLEQDKEILKREAQAEFRKSMARDKRKLLGQLQQPKEEDRARMATLGSSSAIIGGAHAFGASGSDSIKQGQVSQVLNLQMRRLSTYHNIGLNF